MNNKKIQSLRGFTLVELLVVTGIIASLASISSVVVLRQRDVAKKIEAAVLANHIGQSSEFWLEDTYSYPYANGSGNQGGNPPEDDKSYLTGGNSNTSKVISTLTAHDNSVNTSGINYLVDFPIADSNGQGGLLQASANGNQNSNGSNSGNNAIYNALTDPWGNPFILIFDHNDNGKIEADNESFLDAYKNQVWNSTNIVIISAGPDGMFDKINDVIVTR